MITVQNAIFREAHRVGGEIARKNDERKRIQSFVSHLEFSSSNKIFLIATKKNTRFDVNVT